MQSQGSETQVLDEESGNQAPDKQVLINLVGKYLPINSKNLTRSTCGMIPPIGEQVQKPRPPAHTDDATTNFKPGKPAIGSKFLYFDLDPRSDELDHYNGIRQRLRGQISKIMKERHGKTCAMQAMMLGETEAEARLHIVMFCSQFLESAMNEMFAAPLVRDLLELPSPGQSLGFLVIPEEPVVQMERQRSVSPRESRALQYKGGISTRLEAHDESAHVGVSNNLDASSDMESDRINDSCGKKHPEILRERLECSCESLYQKHMLSGYYRTLLNNPSSVQSSLPENWKWDLHYQSGSMGSKQTGVWTCTPCVLQGTMSYPLTIAGAPVVFPVENRWPPMGGVNPPPDPRPLPPIDRYSPLSIDIARDIFITFEGCIGFYLLINGMLQLLIPENFDTTLAASHLPHKYGGLKICYIKPDIRPTMIPSKDLPVKIEARSNYSTLKSTFPEFRRPFRPTSGAATTTNTRALQINDFIEARGKSSHKQKYSGRIGLQVTRQGHSFLIMSSHVITEAMLSRSFLGAGRVHLERLKDDWNDHVEIWAANERIGDVVKSFDAEVGLYPNGFKYDCTLIKPQNASLVRDVKSPITGMGWLSSDSWSSLRQQTSSVKVLGGTETQRSAKSLKCHTCSDVLIVGEGIFLNQTMAAGKPLKDHNRSTWESLVSRAVLYRVSPDFDPPTGYSGIALYAEGTREDGTQGPGIVGFQSFVQTSENVQNFDMEGSPLLQRLQRGRVAFYGAFQVPDDLRRNYSIV